MISKYEKRHAVMTKRAVPLTTAPSTGTNRHLVLTVASVLDFFLEGPQHCHLPFGLHQHLDCSE
jgi:hypothetical protein